MHVLQEASWFKEEQPKRPGQTDLCDFEGVTRLPEVQGATLAN